MRRALLSASALAFIVAAGCAGGAPGDGAEVAQPASSNNNDVSPSGPRTDNTRALVQLRGEPLSTYSKTKPAQGKKIDWDNPNTKSYRAYLSGVRNDFKAWLRA